MQGTCNPRPTSTVLIQNDFMYKRKAKWKMGLNLFLGGFRETKTNWVFEFQGCIIDSFYVFLFFFFFFLPVGSIGSGSRSNLGLPLVPISQQLLLVVQQLFTVLGGVFSVGGCTSQLSVTMHFKVN